MERLIVGVDGSEGAARALAWACDEATRRGSSVIAALAFERHATDEGGLDDVWTEEDARAALDGYVLKALGPDDAERVEREVRCGLPGPTLVDLAADASLLVVGARGHGMLERLLLGSVGEYCLHHSTSPIAVIRGAERARAGRRQIVVGIDGSENAQAALAWAIADAVTDQAQVVVVHAWSVPYAGIVPVGYTADFTVFEDAARATIAGAIAEVSTDSLEQPLQQRLVVGGAAWALLEAAKGADLVVVGSRGRGGFQELLLGSVSHQVSHHASCPVVVVPANRRR